jgi:hypothetical protein
VRSGEVVELLPFGEPSSKVAVVGAGEELIELLLIGPMRALDLAVSALGLLPRKDDGIVFNELSASGSCSRCQNFAADV